MFAAGVVLAAAAAWVFVSTRRRHPTALDLAGPFLLFAAGVLPYYLHLLDKVQGAAHFDVPKDRALRLIAEISAALPGYLVPKLVREVAGAPSKQAVGRI